MKKIGIIFLCMVMLLSLFHTVNAAKVGDIVNQAVYTDIVAKINNYDIASFNINGYTAVVAEDLRAYGFDVQWNGYERALRITRADNSKITSKYVAPYVSASKCGQKAYDVLYTDIKTYIDGRYVTSYNIGGKTIIYMDDLAGFGTLKWDERNRIISLDLFPTKVKGTSVAAYVDGVYIAPGGTIELSVGDTIKLDAKVLPANAEVNTEVKWVFTGSSQYATVTSDGILTGNGVLDKYPYGRIKAVLPDGTGTEFVLKINKATIKVELKDDLPQTLNEYNYKNNIESSVKITGFEYEVSDYTHSEEQTITLYFSGVKLYDEDGSGNSSSCKISWKLYDEEGYVVDSDTCYSSDIATGEKFKKAKDYVFDVMPGKYYLELLNTK